MIDVLLKNEFLIEMIVLLVFLTREYQHKKYWIFAQLLGIIICVVTSVIWPLTLTIHWGAFRFLVLIGLLFGILYISFAEKLNALLFVMTAAYTLQTFLYSLYLILNVTIRYYVIVNHDFVVKAFCYVVTCVIGYFIIDFLSRKMKNNHDINIDNVVMIMFVFSIILISNIFNMLILGVMSYTLELAYIYLIRPVSMITSVLLLSLQFNLLSNKKLDVEKKTLEHLLQEKNKQYQMSKENTEFMKMKIHNMKYQLSAMQLIDKKEARDLMKNIDIYDETIKTGNEVLDVIMTEKALACERLQIKMTVMLDGKKLDFMNSIDLYSMFGNMIDNAIEAVKDQPIEKRMISISSKEVGNLLNIHVSNYYSKKIIMKEGIPQTNKKEKEFHGFGLKSIKLIIEKYKGQLKIESDGQIFSLNILFQLKWNKKSGDSCR